MGRASYAAARLKTDRRVSRTMAPSKLESGAEHAVSRADRHGTRIDAAKTGERGSVRVALECRKRVAGIRVIQVRPVERIEEHRLELQSDALTQSEGSP